ESSRQVRPSWANDRSTGGCVGWRFHRGCKTLPRSAVSPRSSGPGDRCSHSERKADAESRRPEGRRRTSSRRHGLRAPEHNFEDQGIRHPQNDGRNSSTTVIPEKGTVMKASNKASQSKSMALTPRGILAILFRRRRLITLTFLGTAAGLLLAVLIMPSSYQAEVKFL